MHTGCLSAAPQRFVIGSNSFRSLTCFEEPLHSHCSLRAKATSNGRGGAWPKSFVPAKPVAGGRITAGHRGGEPCTIKDGPLPLSCWSSLFLLSYPQRSGRIPCPISSAK